MIEEIAVVAPEKRQINITLSERAWEEMSLVAEFKGVPLATHLRTILEQHHENPAYGALIRRARKAKNPAIRDDDKRDDD